VRHETRTKEHSQRLIDEAQALTPAPFALKERHAEPLARPFLAQARCDGYTTQSFTCNHTTGDESDYSLEASTMTSDGTEADATLADQRTAMSSGDPGSDMGESARDLLGQFPTLDSRNRAPSINSAAGEVFTQPTTTTSMNATAALITEPRRLCIRWNGKLVTRP